MSATAVPSGAPATSTVERALRHIRAAIIDGRLAAGAMLSESDLAAELGVSRTPVRVALARLQDEGWVRIYPKRGVLVPRLTADEVADIADARLVLEISGIMRASTQKRAALAAELTPLIHQQREAFADGDVPRFIDLTLQFHGAFLVAGANRYLIDLGARLSDRQRQMLFAHQDALRGRSDDILEEHQQLLDCLARDDPARFAALLRAHVSETVGQDVGLA